MLRRSFLKSLLGVAAVAASPSKVSVPEPIAKTQSVTLPVVSGGVGANGLMLRSGRRIGFYSMLPPVRTSMYTQTYSST